MMARRKRICFVMEGLNFHGGAHVATSRLMQELMRRGCCVDILTDSEPSEETRRLFPAMEFKVVKLPLHNFRWLVRGIITKLRIGWFPVWSLDPDGGTREWLEQHDVVSVQSELSKFRHLVSTLKGPVRKVQMIHTDYANWANFRECGVRGPRWFRRVTARWDSWWYVRMDVIAVIGESNAEKMRQMMPHLADKIISFHNLFYGEKRKHCEDCIHTPLKLISLTRVHMGAPKCCEWYLSAAKALKDAGISFHWKIYGNGRDLEVMRQRVCADALSDCVALPGYSADASFELANADLTVLLSAYEGMPNVIYESFLSGTPVFSTDVGAVREMIQDNKAGWIVAAKEDEIGMRLVEVVSDTDRIRRAHEELRDYTYDNETALKAHLRILGIDGND